MKVENKSIYKESDEINKHLEKDFKIQQARKRERSIYLIIFAFMILSILNNQSVSIVNFFQDKTNVNGMKYIGIMVFSFLICIGVSKIPYKLYKEKSIKIFLAVASIVVLIFMLVAPESMVASVKGARAWLNLRVITVQPAEMIKIPFVILIASIFAKGEENKQKVKDIVIFSSAVFLTFAILILKENDLGTVIHYGVIYMFMLFLTDVPRRIIERISVLGTLLMGTVFYFIFKYGDKITDYRIQRIKYYLTGLFYNEYDDNLGYQVGQSLLAFGNGGFFGKSYGNGIQKYSYLPEIHTDFIIALFGEELGFIGMIWLIVCFFMLYNLIAGVGMNAKDSFGKYLALGISGYIISQFLINIFVALGLLPVFGIPMPIFSYGGSSIITVFVSLGIVLNINKSMIDKK